MINKILQKERIVIASVVLLFVIINTFFISRENIWFNIFPVVLLTIIWYFISLEFVLLLIVFFVPLSINLQEFDIGFSISVPSEPLILGVVFLFFFQLIKEKKYDVDIIKHPVTIVVILQLAWILVTSLSSEIPLVSFKFLASRLWFVIAFYFMGVLLFQKLKNIPRFIILYTIPLCIVILYTTYLHAGFNFDEKVGFWIMSPFYNDHTAYGVAIALFIPPVIALLFLKNYNYLNKIIALVCLVVLFLGLYLSYSRAAWLSLVLSLGVFLILYFKIKFKYVVLSFMSILVLFVLYYTQIVMKMEKNKQESSKNFTEHVQSITNISSDASNLERLNRWNSAFSMFAERPILGWGPGTYQFVYAPFQKSKDRTIISTNYGDGGNAHSEYFGPLAEQGVLGMIFMLLLIGVVFYYAIYLYKHIPDGNAKTMVLALITALISYFAHGMLNNFLDTDKAAVPVFGFIAMLVALDIYHAGDRNTKNSQETYK